MNRLKVGIVGYGGFGRFLHRSWSEVETVEIVAVADESPNADAAGLKLYRSAIDLIHGSGVDIVSIATPPSTHTDVACAAMEAGKHVLIEKPIATTMEDARRIVETRDRTGVVATVDFMLRFNPIVEILIRWAREKPFGTLRRVLVENYAQDESLPRDHWFWVQGISGGILVEHAVHFIDVVHACTASAPVQVDGFKVARDDGRVDRMGLTAVYDDGLVMTQYHAFSRPGFVETTSMRFVFDLAEVDVEGWIPLSGRIRALVSERTEDELRLLPGCELTRREDVAGIEDQSRPTGWGGEASVNPSADRLQSGGIDYDVSHLVEATFALREDKGTVYANCLRAMMKDLVQAIRDPVHRMRVTLEDGIASLEVALRGSREHSGARARESGG